MAIGIWSSDSLIEFEGKGHLIGLLKVTETDMLWSRPSIAIMSIFTCKIVN